MKKTTIPKWIIQALIFNIAIFLIFIVLIINYFLPKFFEVELKKENLNILQSENNKLLEKWLEFDKFKSNLVKSNKEDNEYLKNILNNPSKDFKWIYNSNLINNWSWSYKQFIIKKEKEIKEKELELSKSKVREKIENILPYYKSDSNLQEKWLTDFKFINYIEKIIHNFKLEYIWTIWIWELTLEKPALILEKNKKINQEDGEIYSFKLPLTLVWNKKSLIDFIYYIENVWNISFTELWDDIKIKEINRKKTYTNKEWLVIKNDFYNLPRYFLWEKDIFNNLIIDIENIKLNDYIDSSFNPISYDKWETFINFIKNDQALEKYEINIDLKFYVKGLEKYKTKKYIENVLFEYNLLTKTFTSTIKFWKNNASKLSAKWLLSLKELDKYNNYLNNLKKDIKDLSNTKKLNEDLGNVYRKAQSIKYIFDNKINNILETDLKNVSEENYNKYKKTIQVKKEKND